MSRSALDPSASSHGPAWQQILRIEDVPKITVGQYNVQLL